MKTVFVEAASQTDKLDIVYSANLSTKDVAALKARLEASTHAHIKVSEQREDMPKVSFESFVKAFFYWNRADWKNHNVDENGNAFGNLAP